EHLQTCEDYFYTEKLAELGELYYSADTHYIHLGEDQSLGQTFQKEIWRSEFNLKSLAGRHVPLREWPSIVLPFWMLGCFLLLLSGLFLPVVIVPALILLLLPVLLYGVRLYRLPANEVNLPFILGFYAVYFIARAIGTLVGLRFFMHRKVST
ncbi:MAG: glycosyltransferase family 2 protein, partial [Paraglaciecola sp.]|nr:glycosyltransferase family 2 protein [Paraglaciecola sp.]